MNLYTFVRIFKETNVLKLNFFVEAVRFLGTHLCIVIHKHICMQTSITYTHKQAHSPHSHKELWLVFGSIYSHYYSNSSCLLEVWSYGVGSQ